MMAMLKICVFILCSLSLTYSDVEAVPGKKTKHENKGDVQLATKDDIRNVLELMKIQEQKNSKLEKEVKIRDKALARHGAAMMKLERIVQRQSQKISKLELDASERSVKLKSKLKSFEEKCNLNCCKFDGIVSNYSNTMDSKSISQFESKEAAKKGHPDQMMKKRVPDREFRRGLFSRQTASGHVSFSVYLSHLQEHLGVHQVVKFDRVITNDGNAYNMHTGVFTVPVTGTYMFIFYVSSSTSNVQFNLVVDDSIKASGVAKPSPLGQSQDVQGGGAVILKLNQGVLVWIENEDSNSEVYSTAYYRWVTFSGFLVY
ncbi:uncharacterized protein LOC123558705 [Mercenaria mercenaria]|uniref:uncharacterized protein LOC123558705 n=1 Tax=Mercenaria mercenaria TaxID=6596 RepID=UPI00234ED963|nr:uncharacterized protein LOC123558705 [Mercenaria mercenaria]